MYNYYVYEKDNMSRGTYQIANSASEAKVLVARNWHYDVKDLRAKKVA